MNYTGHAKKIVIHTCKVRRTEDYTQMWHAEEETFYRQ